MKIRIKKIDYCPKFPYKVQIKTRWFGKWETASHCATLESAKQDYNEIRKAMEE